MVLTSQSAMWAAAAFGTINVAGAYGLRTLRRRLTVPEPASLDTTRELTVSAPGKALIAGGYLVLEAPNVGVTISSTSRFYTSVKVLHEEKAPLDKKAPFLSIIVESPQFHTKFLYAYDANKSILRQVGEEGNDFVEKCLSLTLSFIKEWHGEALFQSMLYSISKNGQLGLKLRADNDFYSKIKELQKRNLPFLSSSLELLPKFMPCSFDPATGKMEVAKTGMGSSAALTTSLVAALLQFFSVVRLGQRKADEDRKIIHNLSQLAHAIAQGKIGSGFDVAAAVYGSQVYTRFNAEPFAACMDPKGAPAKVIFDAVTSDSAWSQLIRPLDLPAGFDIAMGDVCGGSSSTSMAREVLAWRSKQPAAATALWKDLGEHNKSISALLGKLVTFSQQHSSTYSSMLSWASETTSEQWEDYVKTRKIAHWVEPLQLLLSVKKTFKQCRTLLKSMGDQAGVGIEPDSQTALVDATEKLPGVVGAGVPGAGGVDAVFAITLSELGRNQVENMWCSWGARDLTNLVNSAAQEQRTTVCPLVLRADVGARAGVRPEALTY